MSKRVNPITVPPVQPFPTTLTDWFKDLVK